MIDWKEGYSLQKATKLLPQLIAPSNLHLATCNLDYEIPHSKMETHEEAPKDEERR